MILSDTDTTKARRVTEYVAERFADVTAAAVGSTHRVKITAGRKCDLTAGVVDAEARLAFSEGQCHAFAIAANLRTGFPIVYVREAECLENEDCAEFPEKWGWCGCQVYHLAVQRPDGLVWDIYGAHDEAAFLEAQRTENDLWEPELAVVDQRLLKWTLTADSWRTPRVNVALAFVDSLLADPAAA